ncbi:MAG: 4Fe-4S dicluster domain-containing protein, partial [Promethearchaeota archaeon]
EVGIEPTFIGKNKNLVFVIPKELFSMSAGPPEVVDRETAKIFSKYMRGTFKGFENSRKTKYGNENNTKTKVSSGFWENFENKAKSLNVDFIGYTPINEDFIFKDLKVYGKNGVILGMEMKWDDGIELAPSTKCEIEVFRVYKVLGEITIELTEFLKEQGYKSEAHHPFGGKLLYGPHVVAAGLGILGRNGLIITPEFGPRQRWSMITTDADIPKSLKRDFDELKEFCKSCGSCVKNCKGGAIYNEPKTQNSGIFTYIDRSKCIKSLLNYNYCSYCLKICPPGIPNKKNNKI